MSRRPQPLSGIEIAIGPHRARPDWAVLRVSYPRQPEHEARIGRALDALFNRNDVDAPRQGDANDRRAVTV